MKKGIKILSGALVLAVLICTTALLLTGCEEESVTETSEQETTSDEVVETSEPVPTVTPTPTEEPVKEPGSSRNNPIVVTSSQFANEIKSNTDTAKTKYNGKWVQITGKVLSAHDVAGMTSFYLYGEKGGSGLKVVCWINEEVLKPFDYKGETHTFIGQVREVSTANSTEIGNCKIIE